ncbi:MAG: hypothetical protein U0T75_16085 [Chitinophagales bacterium]
MKKYFATALAFCSLCSTAFLASCKKDNTNPSNQTSTVSPTQLFTYSDADGFLVGVKTITYQNVPIIGPQEITIGTAVAGFPTTTGGTTYQDAGTITCNSETLTKQSNSSYVFQPSQNNATGIDFGSGSDWSVSGGGSIPAFTHSFYSFPSSPTITSNTDEVTLANGYTFTINNTTNADSILFILASGSGFVQKRLGGNATTATFSASELSGLQPSQYGLIQVTPYKWQSNTSLVPGKKLYFINQVTVSDFAEFK